MQNNCMFMANKMIKINIYKKATKKVRFSVIPAVDEDYEPFGGGTMYLTAGNMRLCINITIVGSALVEGDETIIVGLSSNEPDAQISPNETTITIARDGGTFVLVVVYIIMELIKVKK